MKENLGIYLTQVTKNIKKHIFLTCQLWYLAMQIVLAFICSAFEISTSAATTTQWW